jgi:CHAD domain-containing protein
MRVDGTTPLWIAAKSLLSERGEDFFQLREKVLETFGPEEIHDLRVASRRLREGLALFTPCYPIENIKCLAKRVKRVTSLLGDIRNTDEAILFFTTLKDEIGTELGIELERSLDSFRKKRKKEMKALKTGLRKIASNQFRDLFRRGVNTPSLFTPPGNGVDLFAPVSHFAGEALDARLARVLKLLPEARKRGNLESQHLLRIAVKHLRYRMEILSFIVGEGYEDMHGALKSYQDILGKMHDLDVFSGIIREAGFPEKTEKALLHTINAKRDKLFDEFSSMLVNMPFARIGAQLGSIL